MWRRGMFVVPWEQTEIDNEANGPLSHLAVGAGWRWWGEAVRVDGPPRLLLLENPDDAAFARPATGRLRRLKGADPGAGAGDEDDLSPLSGPGFVLTCGRRAYTAWLLDGGRLLAFFGLPPRYRELWVVRLLGDPFLPPRPSPRGVICFTPGTRLAAPDGPRPVEDLQPGDMVLTRDEGPQEVLWSGFRHVTGAELLADPSLCPVRLRQGALGQGRPVGDLVVSPSHRVLLRGAAAQALFATSEVLVAARDLIDDRRILRERAVEDVTYIHVMLARHQIVWANGVETESFHPAHAGEDSIHPSQRAAMEAALPRLAAGVHAYGPPARRCLDTPEAALLRHDPGWRH